MIIQPIQVRDFAREQISESAKYSSQRPKARYDNAPLSNYVIPEYGRNVDLRYKNSRPESYDSRVGRGY